MSRVLYISAHAPSTLLQGGHKQAFMFLEKYLASHDLVDIIVITNDHEIVAATDLYELAERYNAKIHTFPLTKWSKLSNCLRRPDLPLKFATRFQKKTEQFIHQLLNTKNYDIVHFECAHAAVYLDSIKQCFDLGQIRIVTSLHDVFLQLLLRRLERSFLFNCFEAGRMYLTEKNIFDNSNEIWTISSKDQAILTSLYSVSSTKVLAHAPKIADFAYKVNRSPEKVEKGSLLYWGSMGRLENEQAILAFIESCFEPLKQIRDDLKLYIVGANPSKKVRSLASNRIIVTGFVDDPTEFFEKAQVGIIPLIEGSGIKLKALEMLEAGLPVLSTAVGAEGINHEKLIVSNDFNEWFHLLPVLFDDSPKPQLGALNSTVSRSKLEQSSPDGLGSASIFKNAAGG